DRNSTELTTQLTNVNSEIVQKTAELEQLNAHVKALGEDELLAVQSTLATQEAERKQLQRQLTELETASQETAKRLAQTQLEIQKHRLSLEEIAETHIVETRFIASSQQQRNEAQQALQSSREAAAEIASASEAWVQQQTAFNRQIETLLQTLEPQRTEQAQ
ncbi:MAG: chromosome segregation protein SMC, partial [Nostoc sp.]